MGPWVVEHNDVQPGHCGYMFLPQFQLHHKTDCGMASGGQKAEDWAIAPVHGCRGQAQRSSQESWAAVWGVPRRPLSVERQQREAVPNSPPPRLRGDAAEKNRQHPDRKKNRQVSKNGQKNSRSSSAPTEGGAAQPVDASDCQCHSTKKKKIETKMPARDAVGSLPEGSPIERRKALDRANGRARRRISRFSIEQQRRARGRAGEGRTRPESLHSGRWRHGSTGGKNREKSKKNRQPLG